MPHVAELSYPGKWLDHEDHEWSLRVEGHFHRLERFLAEAAISLGLFEAAVREREGHAGRREDWRGGLPESYEHLVPYVHARGFVGAMDEVGRELAALEREASRPVSVRNARRPFATSGEAPPHAGMLVLEEREGRWYALRCAGECRREVEVSADVLFAARDCVQAAIRALPWRGPCRSVP